VLDADTHADGTEGALHFTRLAAGATITLVQSGKLLPALPFKGQQMKVTSGDASSASGAARGVDSREGGARPHDSSPSFFQAEASGVQRHRSNLFRVN
jgi:hypothetical protein